MGAVENAGGNSFYDYLLPKMVIILKQGFGRLIRKADDKGAVVLLDKRLRSSLYRREVLASLPDPTIPDVQRVLNEQELSRASVPVDEFEAVARPRLLAVQKAIWNQETFRPGQEAIMRDVLAGKDVLTLLPTGA